jgi:hypothetical protein
MKHERGPEMSTKASGCSKQAEILETAVSLAVQFIASFFLGETWETTEPCQSFCKIP